MKVEHGWKLNCTGMSTIRWMCLVKVNEREKTEDLGELLGLEPVSLMIEKSRLRWLYMLNISMIMTGSGFGSNLQVGGGHEIFLMCPPHFSLVPPHEGAQRLFVTD